MQPNALLAPGSSVDVEAWLGYIDLSRILLYATALLTLYVLIHAAIFIYHWYTFDIQGGRFRKVTVMTYSIGTFVLLAVFIVSAVLTSSAV